MSQLYLGNLNASGAPIKSSEESHRIYSLAFEVRNFFALHLVGTFKLAILTSPKLERLTYHRR